MDESEVYSHHCTPSTLKAGCDTCDVEENDLQRLKWSLLSMSVSGEDSSHLSGIASGVALSLLPICSGQSSSDCESASIWSAFQADSEHSKTNTTPDERFDSTFERSFAFENEARSHRSLWSALTKNANVVANVDTKEWTTLHYFWSCMLPRSAQTKHSPIRMRAMHISNDAIFVSLPERSWPAYAHFTGAIFFERLFTNHRTAMRCFDWHFVSVCY
jgi:hypothetical protein